MQSNLRCKYLIFGIGLRITGRIISGLKVLVHSFSAMHGSLVTSSLLAETPKDVSLNNGYTFGQEDETYSISAAHVSFFNLAVWPVILSLILQGIL
jgi:hypothetical protein